MSLDQMISNFWIGVMCVCACLRNARSHSLTVRDTMVGPTYHQSELSTYTGSPKLVTYALTSYLHSIRRYCTGN